MTEFSPSGLPLNVRFCKKCVISNQRPSSVVEFLSSKSDLKPTIAFDEHDLCSACSFAQQKDEDISWSDREGMLVDLLDRFRTKSGYNVVVPGSGGKDSAFTSHVLKYRYGMNPLTVTWAPHLYTDIGFANFTSWMHVGGLDNVLFTPNGKLHRALTREAFIRLLHPFQPFIVGQRLIGPKIAAKFGIPLVMYGENQAEYGNAISENKKPEMDKKFFSNSDIDDISLGGKKLSEWIEDEQFTIHDFEPYLPLDEAEVKRANVEVHYLGYYLKWDPQECYYYAVENTGFKPNTERTEGSYSKYSSIDDKVDPFHYFTTLIKFGIGRATYDAAQEIRNGKITRSEGVSLVRMYDNEFPSKYFDDFLKYVSLTASEFEEIVDSFRPEHIWQRGQDGAWVLRNQVA